MLVLSIITPTAAVNVVSFPSDIPARYKPERRIMFSAFVALRRVFHSTFHGICTFAFTLKPADEDSYFFSLGNKPSILSAFITWARYVSFEPRLTVCSAFVVLTLELP